MKTIRANTFKRGLQQGRLQRGLWSTINDSSVAEMCAGLGFDWMLFDTEHSPMDAVSVLPLLQAVAPYPVNAMVRPGSLNVADIKKLLDIGAQNILVPMVQNADEAALAVASVTYPPAGIRGVSGMSRATGFGDIAGYHKAARDEIAILVQVETAQAMDDIENIAAVPGVDGIFIGPADLAAAIGYLGEPSHPEVQKTVIDCIKRIVATGVPAGFLSPDLDFADRVIDAGATFVARDIDMTALKRALLSRL